jgi:hypothetical protein
LLTLNSRLEESGQINHWEGLASGFGAYQSLMTPLLIKEPIRTNTRLVQVAGYHCPQLNSHKGAAHPNSNSLQLISSSYFKLKNHQ